MSQHGLRRLVHILEKDFQSGLIKDIKSRFEGAIVLKNDPNYIQGMPDLTVFYKNHYAILEVKKAKLASHRPNQDYYIDKFSKDTFAAFVYPENKEEVLDGMAQSFGFSR